MNIYCPFKDEIETDYVMCLKSGLLLEQNMELHP